MGRSLVLVAATAAALLLVSGAGGSAATSAQTPKRGGTVVVATSATEPACLMPFQERCQPGNSDITLERITSRVLVGPFDVGPDLTWRKRLVTSVDYTRRPPFTLTYHIRPEAEWSDGVPITARDFVFTQRAIVRYWPKEDEIPERTEVSSITALDQKTVRVVLRSRYGGWRGLWGAILPAHALEGRDLTRVWTDRIDDPKTGEPIASGPFLVGGWERGREITLRRNPRYWGSHPSYVDRVVLRFAVDGTALVDGFRSGELDVAAGFPPGFFPSLARTSGLRTVAFPGAGWDHLELRLGPGGHPALRSKLVRRALAFGLDRRALARAIFGDIDPRARERDSVVYPTQSPFYEPNWSGYGHSPVRARRLLEQAGCRAGADGVYVCDGQRLSLRFAAPVIPGGYRPKIVELAKAQLRQIGVEVLSDFAPPSVLFDQILPRGAFDVAVFAWNWNPGSSLKPIFGCGGDQNYTGYCQRLVTADLDQADRILDERQRASVLNRADRRIALDVPVIPLFEQPQWAAVRATVRNFTPTALDPLVNAEDWWLDR